MHNDIRLQGHGYILNYAAALDVILLGRLSYCHNNMNGRMKEPTNGWTDRDGALLPYSYGFS